MKQLTGHPGFTSVGDSGVQTHPPHPRPSNPPSYRVETRHPHTPSSASHTQQVTDRMDFSSSSELHRLSVFLQSMEELWFDPEHAAPSEKEKQKKTVTMLETCFNEVENPWRAALYLTQTCRDYVTAKPNCLAYFCIRTFGK